VEDLHRALYGPNKYFLAYEAVWHAVIALVEFDMVVDMYFCLFPDGEFVGLIGQRLERRAIELFEEFPAGLPQVLHSSVVEFLKQLLDGPIEVRQAEESSVS